VVCLTFEITFCANPSLFFLVSEPSASAVSLLWRKFASPTASLRLVLGGLFTVASLTLLAKAVSFVKDAAVAHWFGVTNELDAFVLAFGLHSFIAATLASGVPAAMMPAYAEARHQLGEERADRLALQSAFMHGLSLLGIGLLAYLCADKVVAVMGKGFDGNTRASAVQLIGQMLPFLFFFGMTTHLATWLRGQKLFGVASASQMATPVVILAWVCCEPSISALVWAANVGALVHLLILLYALRERLYLRGLSRWEKGNKAILKSTGPFLVSGLVMGLTTLVDQAMAGWLQPGSVTVLSYSDKVCGILLAVTALAASEALFPFFADLVAQRDWARLRRQVMQIAGVVALCSVPLALLLSWQAPLVVQLLFERGEFTADATARVAEVLRYAALQIPFYIVGVLLSRIIISLQAAGFSLFLASMALVLNVALNALFMRSMGVAGIALSTACVYLFSSILMIIFVLRVIRAKIQAEAR
jgi:putative peptidoglycan lipid II flippase